MLQFNPHTLTLLLLFVARKYFTSLNCSIIFSLTKTIQADMQRMCKKTVISPREWLLNDFTVTGNRKMWTFKANGFLVHQQSSSSSDSEHHILASIMGDISEVAAGSWKKLAKQLFCDSQLYASLRSCLAELSIRDATAEIGQLFRCCPVYRHVWP